MRTPPIPRRGLGLASAGVLIMLAVLLGRPGAAAPLAQSGPTATPTVAPPTATPPRPLTPTTGPWYPASPTPTLPGATPTSPLPPLPGVTQSPVVTGTVRPPTRTPVRPPTPRPYTNQPRAPFPTITYTDTAISSLDGIWLGELTQGANIRRGPGVAFAVDRNWPQGRRVLVYSTTLALNGEAWYQVGHYPDPTLYIHSSLVKFVAPLAVPAQKATGRWIDVNLTQQTLIAYVDNRPVLLTQTASGKPGYETTVGAWRIYWRTPKQDMDGGGVLPNDPYYNLKDVPWIQYFHTSGEGIHGTYWHDLFGRPRSHGCVNVSIQNANWLYLWAGLGTPVIVHN